MQEQATRRALVVVALVFAGLAAGLGTGFYLGRISAPTLVILDPISRVDSNQAARSRVIEDLLARGDELIPIDGVLGGTMGFHSPDEIYILDDRWVFALFEDGHIGGYMLLEYTVGRSGKIYWTVLATERF